MLRKVKVSIRTKLLLLVVTLVLLSIISYLFFALDLFKKDKTAYIFDTTLSTSSSLSKQVGDFLFAAAREAALLGSAKGVRTESGQMLDRNIFEANPDLFEFLIYSLEGNKTKLIHRLQNNKILKQYNLSSDYFQKLEQIKLPVQNIVNSQYVALNTSQTAGIPHTSVAVYNKSSNEIYVSRYRLDGLINLFIQNKVYNNYVIDKSGGIFIAKETNAILEQRSIIAEPYIKDLVTNDLSTGVREVTNLAGEKLLISYHKLTDFGLIFISSISKDLAFEAAKNLITKSIVFAIFLVSGAIFLSILISRSFTRPIMALVEGTNQIAQKNFEAVINLKSFDEIGVLADSFNFMSKEILHYMGEIKEKARMENELAVAQLVQSSFFPKEQFKTGNIEICGHHSTASECGGDWWGYLDTPDRILIFIGDATGHGVPAALITATANCCVQLLEKITELDATLIQRPEKILSLMNHAVSKVGGKILMTFFICVVDKKTYEVSFSNASHNATLVYKKSGEAPSKDDIDVMLGSVGPRLGHKIDAVYTAEKRQLKPGDALIFFTDGIVEGMNKEGKAWGERRFTKSFLSHVQNGPTAVIEGLLKESQDYYEGVVVDDDITLVAVNLG